MTEEFTFGETRSGDVWTHDEYLQFMYERLILIRELLSEKSSYSIPEDVGAIRIKIVDVLSDSFEVDVRA